jgi:hypothetical protein
MVSNEENALMIWLVLFVLGTLCALTCAAALAIWLGTTVLGGFLTCIERSLTSFTNGHAIVALLYLIPTGLFLCAIGEGLSLMFSFYQAVLR